LYCKIGTGKTKIVEVDTSSPIYVLLEKLKISDKKTKFTFQGQTYCLGMSLTFEDIGLVNDNCKLFFNNQRRILISVIMRLFLLINYHSF
jgi:hypothetical protein